MERDLSDHLGQPLTLHCQVTTKLCPSGPRLHGFEMPPGMGSPPFSWAAYCRGWQLFREDVVPNIQQQWGYKSLIVSSPQFSVESDVQCFQPPDSDQSLLVICSCNDGGEQCITTLQLHSGLFMALLFSSTLVKRSHFFLLITFANQT